VRAVELIAAGKAEEAARTVEALAQAYPDDEAIRVLREQTAAHVRSAEALLAAGKAWLSRNRPEAAAAYAQAAKKLANLDGRIDELATQAREQKRAQMEALATVRALLERGESTRAIEMLTPFGGA